MKNTFKKFVIGSLIAATAATSIIAPTAATVLADDYVVVDLDDANAYTAPAANDSYVWAEVDEDSSKAQADEYVLVEVEDAKETTVGRSVSQKLDKTHYGETRYANVSDFLALRKSATSDSKELARLAPNTKMTIIGTVGNWVKVYVPSIDKDGFVYNQYVSKTMR